MTELTSPLLAGRVVLVTGASRGIGAATARLLGRHGATVGVNYHASADAAHAVVADIEAHGGAAVALRADVRDEAQVAAMRDELHRAAGPVDTLVLNAVSRSGFRPAPLVEQDDTLIAEMASDQLRLSLVAVRALTPGMVERGSGSIIAVGSDAAYSPAAGMGPIGIAKSALAAAMRSLALELGPAGVRVNVVAPGMVLTELSAFIPEEERDAIAAASALGRNAVPEDVAGAVLMLAGTHGGYVTGATVPVIGGARIG